MAVSIIGFPEVSLNFGNPYTPAGGADMVVWATSQKGVGSLSVAEITITGSVSGSITMTSGKVSASIASSATTNNVLAMVIWINISDAPVGDLSGTITFTGTPSASTLRTVVWSLNSTTSLLAQDTGGSGTNGFASASATWTNTNVVPAIGTVLCYAEGNTTSGTNITSVGPGFSERRDVNAGAHRMSGGDLTSVSGGSTPWNVALSASDTGAIALVSFKEATAANTNPVPPAARQTFYTKTIIQY